MADIVTKEALLALSLEKLDALSELVGQVRHEKAVLLRADAKSRILDLAKAAGLSIQDLFGFGAADEKPKRAYNTKKTADGGGTKTPSAPKFKHPENDTITYSGRGRKPQWFLDYIANGGSEKDILIKK